MTHRLTLAVLLSTASLAFTACGGSNTPSQNRQADSSTTAAADTAAITKETVAIQADTTTMDCYFAYPSKKNALAPIVLVIPEWWGLTDYAKSRAEQLAGLGYFAVAVDLFGHGKTGNTPDEAGKLTLPFYKSPAMATARMNAALAKAKTYMQADSSRTAAIGYCFGGAMVVNAARLGTPFKGVVSFHGNLAGQAPAKGAIKADILICHGADDKLVPPQEVAAFKKQMDSVGAHYTFKDYPGAIHSFTNPQATEIGKKFNLPVAYNEAADKNSWNDMQAFFKTVFR